MRGSKKIHGTKISRKSLVHDGVFGVSEEHAKIMGKRNTGSVIGCSRQKAKANQGNVKM